MTTNRTEWLKARRSGIGGSDVAAILGLSRYKTAVDVYEDKIVTDEPEDTQSQAAYFGSVLEDVVAHEFSKRTGMKIQRVNKMLRKGEDGCLLYTSPRPREI